MKGFRTFVVAAVLPTVLSAAVCARADTTKPRSQAPRAGDTTSPPPPPRVYFIEGDSIDVERIRREAARGRDEALKVFDQVQREMLENAKKFRELVPPPDVPGEVILPDTVYTTEVTIGPEGIEYSDTAGEKHVIRGRPVGPDVPFVFSEEGGRIVTGARASDVVQIGTSIHVGRNERIEGNVVVIGGGVEVEGEVKGDVVAVLGDVTIDGYVHGSAVAPLGKVEIRPAGRVRRDVVASVIDDQPGSLIGGRKTYTGVHLPAGMNIVRGFYLAFLLLHIGLAVFTVFLVLLGHVFAAKNIVRIKSRISTNGIKSFVIGLLVEFLGVPTLFVLLLITVIGIPVALLALPIAVGVAAVLGFAAFGLLMGEKLADNTGFHLPTQLGKTIAGLGVILLLVVFGALLVLVFGSPLSVIGWTLFGIGHAIVFIAVTTGLGAVALTRFGTRPKPGAAEAAGPAAALSYPPSPASGETYPAAT